MSIWASTDHIHHITWLVVKIHGLNLFCNWYCGISLMIYFCMDRSISVESTVSYYIITQDLSNLGLKKLIFPGDVDETCSYYDNT